MVDHTKKDQVVIVGGGLAGLGTAAYLARAGREVTVYEKSQEPGGRARTETLSGYKFNLGPHALYRRGRAAAVLQELGVKVRGGVPGYSGAYAIDGGRRHTFPSGFLSLLVTGVLGVAAKFETAHFLARLPRIETGPLVDLTVDEWLTRELPEARRLIASIIRLATYADEPVRQSAGAALAQLQLALSGNVSYLDGGWAQLIDELRVRAIEAGARIVTGARVASIVRGGEHEVAATSAASETSVIKGVRLADGTRHEASTVVIAAGPREAAALVERSDETRLRLWAEQSIPIEAACLELGLRRLPDPRATFAMGIDRPLYFSVHSAVARLAPEGASVIHVAKYLRSGVETDPREDERELEGLLDLMQPGWRAEVATRRFRPRMTVSNALVTAGGTAGRPGPAVPGVDGLYVAGDWVGSEGMLADASLSSARAAAQLILGATGRALAEVA